MQHSYYKQVLVDSTVGIVFFLNFKAQGVRKNALKENIRQHKNKHFIDTKANQLVSLSVLTLCLKIIVSISLHFS